MRTFALALALAVVLGAAAGAAPPDQPDEAGHPPVSDFLDLLQPAHSVFEPALQRILAHWRDGYAPMLIEAARFSPQSGRIMAALDPATGQRFRGDRDAALRWIWAHDFETHPHYAEFKAQLYGAIDPHFSGYFDDSTGNALIRLDEVRWGGVRRDGIPPLDRPRMIPVQEAHYLEPEHVVFGLEHNGDARAYPKRILAWHELFKDTVGGVPVTGVYCALCGSMIVYRSEHAGVHHDLGTSGFLYRSNKLMVDRATESLWSTLRGMPVIGPLAGKPIHLEPLAVVTTTWGAWSKRHPDGSVLSLDTGHRRDYAEGAAYWRYFASDELMFEVPRRDERLANKAEVLALRFGPAAPPTAIDVARLERASIYHGALGETPYVILTDDSGASRVYASRSVRFEAYDRSLTATDSEGITWTLREDALAGPDGARLERLPAHRAFWFGWYAAHPDTILVR